MSEGGDEWDCSNIDNFAERVEKYTQEAQNERNSENDGVDAFRPRLRRRVLLSDRTAYMLSLDELRYLPKFLCDITLRTPDAEINEDHFQYWAWTGCLVGIHNHIQVTGDDYGSFSMTRFDSDILRDLSTLLQISLLVKREESLVARGIDVPSHAAIEYNPSYSAIFTDSFRILTRMATSVLEGLLRRRCKALNKDGTLKDRFIDPSFEHIEKNEHISDEDKEGLRRVYEDEVRISGYVNRRIARFWEILPMWQKEYAEPATKEALGEIEHFDDETKKNLHYILGDQMDTIMENLRYHDSENDFYSFLSNVRNPTAHNEQIYHSLASIFVNLCCMVFWDQFPDAFYDKHRTTFFETLDGHQQWGLSPGFRPTYFYPL
ncbi:hypothetical protein [Natronorubrum sulfidifaciens]|uniref:hypothetical protein n=1 Tax=Natronorubrum sulfidifaciens TaxID=388259 RepID=UPI0012675A9D|nr:hypothetical protein [Natronorubrum sulfidifaciens]